MQVLVLVLVLQKSGIGASLVQANSQAVLTSFQNLQKSQNRIKQL